MPRSTSSTRRVSPQRSVATCTSASVSCGGSAKVSVAWPLLSATAFATRSLSNTTSTGAPAGACVTMTVCAEASEARQTIRGSANASRRIQPILLHAEQQNVGGGVRRLYQSDAVGHDRRAGRRPERPGVDRLHVVGGIGDQAGRPDEDRIGALIRLVRPQQRLAVSGRALLQ